MNTEKSKRIQVAWACIGDSVDGLKGAFCMKPTTSRADIDTHVYQWKATRLNFINEYIDARRLPTDKPWPEREIAMATVNTVYIPLYRIHSKEFFLSGMAYPNNWWPSDRKKVANERFSPPGVESFYFGLTLEAAENEARFYGNEIIDPQSQMILVVLACFDTLLYLPICIQAVWDILGLPEPKHPMEMLLATMDPSTNNYSANEIGKWARASGFKGIIYPAARYGEVERFTELRAQGKTIIPEINYVHVGSHLCRNLLGFIAHSPLVDWYQQEKGLENSVRIFTEPNLVVFDGRRLMGDPWGVVYETFPLNQREKALHWDDARRQVKPFVFTLDL